MPPRHNPSHFNINNAVAEHTIPEHSSVQVQGTASHIRSFSDSHANTKVSSENGSLQSDQKVSRFCSLGSSEQSRPRIPRIPPVGKHTSSAVTVPFRTSTAIDFTLLPKPLKLRTADRAATTEDPKASHSLLIDDEVVMSAAIDLDGSVRKSLIMSIIKSQNPEVEDSFQTLPSNPMGWTEQVSPDSNTTPAVIYFLPSFPTNSSLLVDERCSEQQSDPSSPEIWDEDLSPLAKLSAKAQQILGAADLDEIYDLKTNGKNPPLCLCN